MCDSTRRPLRTRAAASGLEELGLLDPTLYGVEAPLSLTWTVLP